MKKRFVIAIVSKTNESIKDENKTTEIRELGLTLRGEAFVTLTHFSPALTYVKEAIISVGGVMISLSPACSKEEHETIFRYGILEGETILYTGLGKQLTILTLLRSADCIICLDEEARREIDDLRDESVEGRVFTMGKEARDYIHDKTSSL